VALSQKWRLPKFRTLLQTSQPFGAESMPSQQRKLITKVVAKSGQGHASKAGFNKILDDLGGLRCLV
jgi:hypothetical protein